MSDATSTAGLQLQRADDAGTSFTLIPEVSNLKGPSEKAAQIDVTSYDSAAMEYIGGLPDNGELTFDLNFIGSDTQHQGLRSDLRNKTKRVFKIVLPDSEADPTTVTFTAIVTSAPDLSGGINAAIKSSCAMRITGASVWHYSAG